MEDISSRGRFRFLPPVKKAFAFALLFHVIFPFRLASQVKLNGFLSLDFIKGQEQSIYSHGTFGNVKGGIFLSPERPAKFSYAFEVQFKRQSEIEIEQAWVGFTPSDAFRLKAGLFLVPFGKYNEANRPYQTSFIVPPLSIEESYPSSWRDVGILAEGKTGSLSYAAYIGNGLRESQDLKGGQQFEDSNSDKGWGGRLGLFLGQEIEIGISYHRGKYDDPGERELILRGADLTWRTKDFLVYSEYTQSFIENPPLFSRGEVEGYFIQLALNFRSLTPFLSYQKSNYEDSFHGLGFLRPSYAGMGIFREGSRWAAGVVVFLTPEILFKAEYDFNRKPDIDLKDDVFAAQVAVHF